MALYKIITAEPTVADTAFSSLTGSATNTIVTSVVCTDAATPVVQLLIQKSGGSALPLAKSTLVAGIPKELLTTSFALQSGDILYTKSTTTNSDFIISYAEDTVVSAGGVSGVTITTDTGAGAKAIDTAGSADFTLIGATGVGITNSGATITATAVPGEIDHDSLSNFLAAEHVDWAGSSAGTIHASNYIENVSTTLSAGTVDATTYGITSDGGANDIVLPEATTSVAGLLGAAKWDEIVANTAKAANVSTNLSATANGTSLTVESSDGSNVALPAATNTAWGIMSDDHVVALEANTAKTSFSNLTGEVTSSGAATTIAGNIVDEANLKVSNAPTNGYFLSAQSGNSGGLTWAASGGGVSVSTQAVNRLVACSASSDVLDGEANLTFNGSTLSVVGAVTATGSISGNGSSLKVGKLDTQAGAASAAGEYGLNAEIYTDHSTTVVTGSFYALDSAAWVASNATTLTTASKGMIGMATSTGSGTGVVIRGICYVLNDPGGAIGDVVYLSTAVGRLTTTPVSGTTGFVSRVMGYKIGTNLVFLNPSQDWIVLS